MAERFRGSFASDDVKVFRPLTSEDFRFTGLDDSITPEELVAAVAKVENCFLDHNRFCEIRMGPSSTGTTSLGLGLR